MTFVFQKISLVVMVVITNHQTNDIYLSENQLGSDGFYYQYHSEGATWFEAASICESGGGTLAIPWNKNTNHIISSFLPNGVGWIGIKYVREEKIWRAFPKIEFRYSNWALGQPNEMDSVDADCGLQGTNELWYDISCQVVLPFLCQFPGGDLNINVVINFFYLACIIKKAGYTATPVA